MTVAPDSQEIAMHMQEIESMELEAEVAFLEPYSHELGLPQLGMLLLIIS
jgi:hypothetical protein